MRINPLYLTCCLLLRCYGPDIGSPAAQKGVNIETTVTLPPAPQIILPVDGYRTSSPVIRFQTDDNSLVDGAEVEIYQSSTLVYSGSATAGVNYITLPGSPTGSFTLRARNKKGSQVSAYTNSVAFKVEDYAAATQLYAQNYSTVTPGCGDTNEPFGTRFVFCNADPHWNALCSGMDGGGGNVWICDTSDTLGANNSGTGTYSANNANFSGYNAPDGTLTATGYLQNASGSNDGLGISCRDAHDGNNNHYAAWFYPNRNPATSDNLVLVRHYSDNTNTTLASGRFTELQNRGAGAANIFTMRLDCLGSHITVYYDTGTAMKPLLSVSDTSLSHNPAASFFALGVGPGGVTTLHARMTTLAIKRYP